LPIKALGDKNFKHPDYSTNFFKVVYFINNILGWWFDTWSKYFFKEGQFKPIIGEGDGKKTEGGLIKDT
jgi:hypothetical protein